MGLLLLLYIFLFLTIFLGVLYLYSTRNFNFWNHVQVSGPRPLPFFGNVMKVFTMKISIGGFLKNLYRFSEEPYVGFFIFDEPCLLIRSPDIIKNVLATDHKYFQSRTVTTSGDDLFARTIFAMKGSEWKETKSKLSSEFSFGKVKNMVSVMKEACNEMICYLKNYPGDYDAKTISRKYAIDVITRCFFGVKAHSFDSEASEFEQVGNAMFAYTIRNAISQTLCFFKTSLAKLFSLQFFSSEVQNYFMNVCQRIMGIRKELKLTTGDFLATLMKLNQEDKTYGEYLQ